MSTGVNIMQDDAGRGAFIEHAVSATPSDSTVYQKSAGVYVGTTGNLAVTLAGGAIVTFTNIPVGLYPISVTKVMAATTASGILVVW
jgi:hypothetical protein